MDRAAGCVMNYSDDVPRWSCFPVSVEGQEKRWSEGFTGKVGVFREVSLQVSEASAFFIIGRADVSGIEAPTLPCL